MKKSRLRKYIALLIVAIISCALLVFALIYNGEMTQTFNLPYVKSETMYIVFVLAWLLPISISILARAVRKKRVVNVNEEYDDYGTDRIEKRKKKKRKKITKEYNEKSSIDNTENEMSFEKKKLGVDQVKKGGTTGALGGAQGAVAGAQGAGGEAKSAQEGEEENKKRFYMLSKIDELAPKKAKKTFETNVSLQEICERFRNFSASELGLYYDIHDIRRFIASLAVTKIIVMQGMSGTGKTSLAYAFGEFLKNQSTIVPIQPMWKERTDLIGYYNEFTKKFNETVLLQKLYEANYSEEIFVTVLDEMNIARVEYYFAEFLSLLEIPAEEGRYLDVVSDEWADDPKLFRNGQIKLPNNMWFIGTANNDDSTFAISDKVYDRAMVMNLDKKAKAFDAPKTESLALSVKTWEKLVNRAMREYEITQRNLRRIAELDKYMIKTFQITFGNRIMKQLRQYVAVYIACGGTELEAIDDILAKKVLRKLESKNPVLVRNSADGFREKMIDLFGEDNLTLCREYLEHLEKNS